MSIEEEFERITGVKPDKIDFSIHGPPPEPRWLLPEPEVKKMPWHERRQRIIDEYMKRNLGEALCEMDEDVAELIRSMRPEDRPRSSKQKNEFARAFYAGEKWIPPPPIKGAEKILAMPEFSSTFLRSDAEPFTPATAASAPVPEKSREAPDLGPQDPSLASARRCMDGLGWSVTREEGQLLAVVAFSDDLWYRLQGDSSLTFKDAVAFELAPEELRVMHAGAAVLDLQLHRAVDANAASAKLSGKHRRVTVRAPLR